MSNEAAVPTIPVPVINDEVRYVSKEVTGTKSRLAIVVGIYANGAELTLLVAFEHGWENRQEVKHNHDTTVPGTWHWALEA